MQIVSLFKVAAFVRVLQSAEQTAKDTSNISLELCISSVGCTCDSWNDKYANCTCGSGFCTMHIGSPRIKLSPPPPYEIERGGNMNITCSAVGYPLSEVYWEPMGPIQYVQNEKVDREVTIPIKNYQSTVFRCAARNVYGLVKTEINLTAYGTYSKCVTMEDCTRCTPFNNSDFMCSCSAKEECEAPAFPPRLLFSPAGPYVISTARAMVVYCKSMGNQIQKVEWRVREDSPSTEDVFTIKHSSKYSELIVSVHMSAEFVCHAFDDNGTRIAFRTLLVKKDPSLASASLSPTVPTGITFAIIIIIVIVFAILKKKKASNESIRPTPQHFSNRTYETAC